MKKLLVAAMGIAAAYGAFADPFSVGKRFEGLTVDDTVTTNELNEAAGGGTYWTDPVSATNTYTVKAMGSYTGTVPAIFENDDPTKALEVKTTFGSPLAFNFMGDGGTTKKEIGDDGLYFDSLVKFTVCDGEPEDKEAYNNAKIMMWLQSNDDNGPTNIMIRAGYLTYSAGQVGSVETNYTCYPVKGDFADSWHRVTIKAIKNITSTEQPAVPGFVVFIDGDVVNVPGDYDVWGDGFPALNAKAAYWASSSMKALFPSMVQSGDKTYLSAIEFDGTGSLNDVAVTETAPAFAVEPAAPEVAVTINGAPHLGVVTFADAVTAVNGGTYGAEGTATITLSKDAVITEPLEFTANATITLDFAGFVLTNELAEAMITNSARSLVIMNSSGNGGINCTSTGGAFYQTAATFVVEEETVYSSLSITGGNFWGESVDEMITVAEDYEAETQFISGGAFQSNMNDVDKLVHGKAFDEVPDENNLYPVINAPTTYYTIGFAYGDPLTTNSSQVAAGALPSEPSAEAVAVEGKGFAGWDDTIVAAAADKVYTAQYTNNIYTITFVIGEDSTPVEMQYGAEITSVPTPAVVPGYTGSWDDDPTGDIVTGNKTYTYTYTGKAYTVDTYTNNVFYATYSGTYAGAAPILASPVVGEGQSWDGKWYTADGGETEFSFNPDAEGAQSAYATVTEDEPTPVTPSKDLTPPAGKTPAEYAEEINGNPAAYIAVPAVAEATSSTYLSLMKAQVKETDSSKVEIVFNKEAEAYAAVTNQVEAAVAAIPVAAAASATQSFNLTAGSATPGLWYSVTSGNSLSGMNTHSTSVQAAADGSVTGLQAPTYPAKGFYRIDVSPTQDYTPAP